MEEKDGVWRTIRGRRIFIGEGESLGQAMKNSGKFNDNGRLPKREDYHKAKKQLALEEANEKENKAYDYVYKKPKDEKQKEQWRKKADKATENRIKANKEYNDYMELYDKDRPDEEMSWQDRVERNNREAYRKAEELKGDRENDAYYQTFRDNEERNAKIKEEPDNAPYEPINAYKGYMDKFSKHGDNDKWTGKEYTNDEFMEHLEDANWHTERKVIEEAGLTNKQMTELKNQVKLSKWSAELDKNSTQALIDKVKKEFPAKEQKIADFKTKKQSNNKVDNDNKYSVAKHEGFGDYNKDNIPVYDNKIDYTGDFGRNANLKSLSDNELNEALRVQTEELKKAQSENVGDQRYRNNRMSNIFKNARVNQYTDGVNKIKEELESRQNNKVDNNTYKFGNKKYNTRVEKNFDNYGRTDKEEAVNSEIEKVVREYKRRKGK